MQEAGKGEKDEGQQRSLFYPKPGKFASRTTLFIVVRAALQSRLHSASPFDRRPGLHQENT